MSRLTDDPSDPQLTHGPDSEPVPQSPVYLVLSETERAKGFIRPVRQSYLHVGVGGTELNLVAPGCGVETTMSLPLAETYARDPKFYGSTYCVGCRMHLPVAQFIWTDTDERVGS
jgi:hypothetical protein